MFFVFLIPFNKIPIPITIRGIGQYFSIMKSQRICENERIDNPIPKNISINAGMRTPQSLGSNINKEKNPAPMPIKNIGQNLLKQECGIIPKFLIEKKPPITRIVTPQKRALELLLRNASIRRKTASTIIVKE